MQDLDNLLDEYEAHLGLPGMGVAEIEVEGARLLSLSPRILKTMSAVECGEASVVLEQFSFHLQRALNRERTRAAWCEENVKRIIAKVVGGCRGYSWEERRALAVTNDDVAMKFDALRVKCQNRINRVEFYSSKVDALSKSFLALQQTKRGNRGFPN